MSEHYVILDWQHHGKPGKYDRGASNGDLVEIYLTLGYINAAKDILEDNGHRTGVLSYGWYSKRHEYACEAAKGVKGKCVYVACHVNAGEGNYSLVCHDSRSGNGKAFAEAVGTEMEGLLSRSLVKESSEDVWTNAFNTIKGIYAGPANSSGVCFEPGFIDQGGHKHLWSADGLVKVGTALAAGIINYLET